MAPSATASVMKLQSALDQRRKVAPISFAVSPSSHAKVQPGAQFKFPAPVLFLLFFVVRDRLDVGLPSRASDRASEVEALKHEEQPAASSVMWLFHSPGTRNPFSKRCCEDVTVASQYKTRTMSALVKNTNSISRHGPSKTGNAPASIDH